MMVSQRVATAVVFLATALAVTATGQEGQSEGQPGKDVVKEFFDGLEKASSS